MRARTYLRIGFAVALVMSLLATGDGYSQRGKGGGKAAGHKAASAPKVANSGPAMSRPAGGQQGGPQRDAPRAPAAKAPSTGAKLAGGPGAGGKAPANFQRPAANRPGDAKPGLGKIGGDTAECEDSRPPPGQPAAVRHATAQRLPRRRPGRPGEPVRSNSIREEIGDIGKKRQSPVIGKKTIGLSSTRSGRPPSSTKSDRPDVTVDGHQHRRRKQGQLYHARRHGSIIGTRPAAGSGELRQRCASAYPMAYRRSSALPSQQRGARVLCS